MAALQNLNGWQRLFVIAAVLWLFAVANGAARQFPTEAEHRAVWLKIAEAQTPSLRKLFDECRRSSTTPAGGNPYVIVVECESNAMATLQPDERRHYDAVIAKGEAEIRNDLPSARVWHVIKAALAWIVPVSLLYVLGMLVKWVIAGFRRSTR